MVQGNQKAEGEEMKKILCTMMVISGMLITRTALGKNLKYSCTFSNPHIIEYKNSTFHEYNGKDTLSIEYIYDTTTNKAYMIGNNGVSEEIAILTSSSQTTFIETTQSGNVTVTSIYPSKTNKKPSIHSRHINMLDGSVNSQFYGYCDEIK